MEFRVEFGKSGSPVFGYALDLARQSPTFRVSDNRFSASYDHLPDFMAIARYIHGWKSARLTIDGRVLSGPEYHQLLWVAQCHERKQEYINRDFYCHVQLDGQRLVFPCRFINIFPREITRGKYGSPILNKRFLAFAVEQEVRRSLAHCCPDMDPDRMLQVVEDLPDLLPEDAPYQPGHGLHMLLRDIDLE